jgi:hypothetical protein
MREVGVEERHRHVYVYDTLHTELQPPPSHAGRLGCTSGPHHYREGFKGRVGPQAHVSSSSSFTYLLHSTQPKPPSEQ